MPAVRFATNWHIFFGYCVSLGDHTVPLAFRTIFNNACCVCAMWWRGPCRGRLDDNPAPRQCSCWLGVHHHPASFTVGRMKILSFCWCCFMFPNPILCAARCITGPSVLLWGLQKCVHNAFLISAPHLCSWLLPLNVRGTFFFTVRKTWSLEVGRSWFESLHSFYTGCSPAALTKYLNRKQYREERACVVL